MKHLQTQDSLRILDIGPTSSTNINYITSLGHSIYMASVVDEASKPEWLTPGEDGQEQDGQEELTRQRTVLRIAWVITP